MKKSVYLLSVIVVLFIAVPFAGCGGGGGGGDNTSLGENYNPDVKDVIAPYISITSPPQETISTNKTSISVSGIAEDNKAVASITWSSSRGGSGSASGLDEWMVSDIPLAQGDNVITVTVNDYDGNQAKEIITVTCNPYLNFLSKPQSTPDYVFINESYPVTFQVAIENNPNLLASSVRIAEVDVNNNIISTVVSLADDGNVNNGDQVASDGVFCGVNTFSESAERTIRLRVIVETTNSDVQTTAMSEVFSVQVIKHLTDSEISDIVSMPDQIQKKYDELSATMTAEESQTKTMEWLKQQPGIADEMITPSGISYEFTSGVWGVLLLYTDYVKEEDVASIPSSMLGAFTGLYDKSTVSGQSSTSNSNLKGLPLSYAAAAETPTMVGNNWVLIVCPFANQGGSHQLSSAPADRVSQKFKDTGFNVNQLKDTEVTVEKLKTLGDYGTIIINTHGAIVNSDSFHSSHPNLDAIEGYFRKGSHLALMTGETQTEGTIKIYEADLKLRRMVLIDNLFGVTPDFIKTYNMSFPNSIVYNGACFSDHNTSWSNAFLGNGANVYFGYTLLTNVKYGSDTFQSVFDSLINGHKTVHEAWETATTTYGYCYPKNNIFASYFKVWGKTDTIILPPMVYGIVTLNGAGLPGVTITLSGSDSGTTVTDTNGVYEINHLKDGSYMLTPSAASYTFSPASVSVEIKNGGVTFYSTNVFTAKFTGHTIISGRVTLNGTGWAGVTVTLNGSNSKLTDSNGAYSFTDVTNGSYIITPSLAGYSFSPSHIVVTVNNGNPTVPSITARLDNPGDPISVLLSTLVSIPAGSLMMGSTDNEYQQAQYATPVHEVTLQGFEIGAYEVTQAQYEAIMGTNPSYCQGIIYDGYSGNNPVDRATWYNAREFCTKLSALTGRTFTLPSESQWEYACRAGTTSF
jgi:hypothetical protein